MAVLSLIIRKGFRNREVLSLARKYTAKYFGTIVLLSCISFVPNLVNALFSFSLQGGGIAFMDPTTGEMTYNTRQGINGQTWGIINTIVSIVCGLLSYRLLIGFIKCTIMIAQNIKPAIKDLTVPVVYLARRFFAFILTTICVIVGFILFIIPGIWVAIRLSMVQYFIAEGYGIMDSLRGSRAITKGNVRSLIILGIIALAINSLGMIALFLGLLRTIPLIAITYAIVYLELKKNLPPEIQPIATTKATSSLETQMMNA